jgi:hypothetical protein
MDMVCPDVPAYLYDMAEKERQRGGHVQPILFFEKYPEECTFYVEQLIGYVLYSIKDTNIEVNKVDNFGCGFDATVNLNGVNKNLYISYLSNHILMLDTLDTMTKDSLKINPKKPFPCQKVREYILDLFNDNYKK